MAKFEGLVWKKGDDGWKDIPVGIGGVGVDFDVQEDEAALRMFDAVVAGFGGKSIDFTSVNELLSACPPEGGELKILWGGVHPTNLKAAILVWSAPVVILDPTKISGGDNPSLNGRIMTLAIKGVKIDGSDSVTVSIQAGAVGGYATENDPGVATVSDTSEKVYAGTRNDTSVGADQPSQTAGKDLTVFSLCPAITAQVKVSSKYKMEDAKQSCGEPHKIWGACYCIWGSTAPMETFPYGTTMDIDPGNLSPPASFYGGTVAADSYVDRGIQFDIAVAGIAGPVIKVKSVNDKNVPLQPGQAVSFQTYLCDTVCGQAKMTKLHDLDEALAYVDEDIIKPKERTFPVYTFLETTYYMTTMTGLKTTEIEGFTTTELKTKLFTKMWQDIEVLDTAVKWTTDLRIPETGVGLVALTPNDTGSPPLRLPKETPLHTKVFYLPESTPTFDVGIVDPVQVPFVVANAPVSVLGAPADVVIPCINTQFIGISSLDPESVGSHPARLLPANAKGIFSISKADVPLTTSAGYVGAVKEVPGQFFVKPPIGTTKLPIQDVSAWLPKAGTDTVKLPLPTTILSRIAINLNNPPDGSYVLSDVPGTVTISTARLVVCGPGGAQTMLDVLVLPSPGAIVVAAPLSVAPVVPYTTHVLSAPANVTALTSLTLEPVTAAFYCIVTDTNIDYVTSVPLEAPVVQTIPDLAVVGSQEVVVGIVTAPPYTQDLAVAPISSPKYWYNIETTPVVPSMVTAITASLQSLPTRLLYPVTNSLGLSVQDITGVSDPVAMYTTSPSILVAGNTPYDPLELFKYKELVDLTAFDPNGDPLVLMKPKPPEEKFTLVVQDPEKIIPVLDVSGPPDKAVQLLIKNTDGNLSMIGMTDKLDVEVPVRLSYGKCNPGSMSVFSNPGDEYEKDGEVKLLAPLPVPKNKGNAEECPCFTSADPDGGPSKPQDNSTLGSPNPCTLRVRRLQLKECHK